MVIRTVEPVRAGKFTWTGVTEPWGRPTPGSMEGSGTVREPEEVETVIGGGDRVLPVGHHLEIQMIEGHRLAQGVLDPVADLVPERRHP